jgi:hypothetical protein
MGVVMTDSLESLVNLGSKQISMLEADVVRRSLEVNINPAALLEAIGVLE